MVFPTPHNKTNVLHQVNPHCFLHQIDVTASPQTLLVCRNWSPICAKQRVHLVSTFLKPYEVSRASLILSNHLHTDLITVSRYVI